MTAAADLRLGGLEPDLDTLDVLAALFGDMRDRDWQVSALCAQTDPDEWFQEKGGSTKTAKAICKICPVRAECLEYAITHDERFGVWGGLSERERRPLVRAAKTGAVDRLVA